MVEMDGLAVNILTMTNNVKLAVLVKLNHIDKIPVCSLVVLGNRKTRNKVNLVTLANKVGNLGLADSEGQSIGI